MKLMEKIGLPLYNVSLAFWVGGISVYTFLVTPAIFRSFGRDAASSIVDKLFPFYFSYILSIVCLATGTFLLSGWKKNSKTRLCLALLVIAILITLFVNLWLYPEVKRVKQGISSFEKASADLLARKQFRVLHGISMSLNIILLIDGMALIVISPMRHR